MVYIMYIKCTLDSKAFVQLIVKCGFTLLSDGYLKIGYKLLVYIR